MFRKLFDICGCEPACCDCCHDYDHGHCPHPHPHPRPRPRPLPMVYNFGSATPGRTQSGTTGLRSGMTFVGIGHERLIAYTDPVLVDTSGIAIKPLVDGTITEVVASLSLALPITDYASTVYAQLYKATGLDSREFFPVDGTLMTFEVPHLATTGTTFTAHLKDLHIKIEDNEQLLLGFYSTSEGATAGVEAYMGGSVKIIVK